MINPIYEKILNVICKSSCGTTCDKCCQCVNSCAKYVEYSKLAVSLGKSGLFSLDKANIPNAQDILNTVNTEKQIYEYALQICAISFNDLRKKMGLGNDDASAMAMRYYFIAKEVINGRKRRDDEDKRRQYHPSNRR